MPRVVVVGPRAAMLPFRAVGMEIIGVDDVEQAKDALHSLYHATEILVLLPEDWMVACANEVSNLRKTATTAVLALPSLSQAPGAQLANVRALVTRSLGVDLMSNSQ